MQTAAILFGLAALGGLAMVGIRVSQNKNPPTALAVGHGLIAATGLVVLLYQAFTETDVKTLVQVSIGVFVVAALGGIAMFALFHLKGRQIPIAFMIVHGAIAAAGLVLLLLGIYR